MVLISDQLNIYRADKTRPFWQFQQDALNRKLFRDLEAWAATDPGARWFSWMLRKATGCDGAIHPDTLTDFCAGIGFVEVESFGAFLQQIGRINVDGLIAAVDPPLSLGTLTMLSRVEIHAAVTAAAQFEEYHRWGYWSDDLHMAIRTDDLRGLVAACPSGQFVYVKESRDCDDFQRIFLGWLSWQGYGNLVFGTCDYNGYDADGRLIVSHGVIIAVTISGSGEREVYLVEPQTDLIWKPDRPSGIFSGVDHIRVREIRF